MYSATSAFFFQAEDGIRDRTVTGVQTCASSDLDPDGRAVRRARRPDAHAASDGSLDALEPGSEDDRVRHARHRGGDRPRRPRACLHARARPRAERASHSDRAAARRAQHLPARRLRGNVRAHPQGALVIAAARVALGIAALALWQAAHWAIGAEWISGPADVVRRLLEITASGELARHTLATLTEAAFGFLLGGGAGILLPFALLLSL